MQKYSSSLIRFGALLLAVVVPTTALADQHDRAAQQRQLQKQYKRLIVGKWAKSPGQCRLVPDFIFLANGRLKANETEGWWRLSGSKLYAVGFDYDSSTPETKRSGPVGSWAVTWQIQGLNRRKMTWRDPKDRSVRRFVRCRN